MVLIGIESFELQNLKQMNKQWNSDGLSIEDSIKRIHQAGIMIYGTFIFGYDFDTPDSFFIPLNFAMKNKFFIANFNPLYPMPGTELYERLESENRLMFKKWWLDPDFYYGKSMYYPKLITPVELEEKCFETKTKFNSWKSIIKRGLNKTVWKSAKVDILSVQLARTCCPCDLYCSDKNFQ